MCSDDVRMNRIVISELDFDALAERGEHLRENYLFVPHRRVAVLFD